MVDRFICRREGHKPSTMITFDPLSTLTPTSYFTTCLRCGEWFEIDVSTSPPPPPPPVRLAPGKLP
jgi:hypothetical protein